MGVRKETLRLLLVVCVMMIMCTLLSVKSMSIQMHDNSPPLSWSGEKVPYSVLQLDNAFTKQECETVMRYMSNKVNRSTVVGSGGKEDIVSTVRTSSSAWIKHSSETHPPDVQYFLNKFMHLGSQLSGVYSISDNFEDISVVRYHPNQYYRAHYDSCSTKAVCGDGNRVYRIATCILYLNDNFSGGETEFPKTGITVVPKTGKLLFFYNTHRDGTEIEESLHAGKDVISGDKWIATLWIRFKPDQKNIELLNK
jgi:prolyl 4-hydroxylase